MIFQPLQVTGALPVLLFFCASLLVPTSNSATIIYSISSEKVILHNQEGGWGGDIPIGYNQTGHYQVDFHVEDFPFRVSRYDSNLNWVGSAEAGFIAVQLFNLDTGHSSDFIEVLPPTCQGSLVCSTYVSYGNEAASSELDRFGGVWEDSFQGINFYGAFGEFGEPGDPMPWGSEFDAVLNSSRVLFNVTSGWFRQGRLFGDAPSEILEPGEFTFSSIRVESVPLPATLWLFCSAFLGLAIFKGKDAASV